jgi:hypothetical protein
MEEASDLGEWWSVWVTEEKCLHRGWWAEERVLAERLEGEAVEEPTGDAGAGAGAAAASREDHVWFEDRWMVTSLCDEWLTTLCGLILG